MIAFLTSPLGKIAIAIVILGLWTAYQRDQAADKAREECQSEQLKKTLDETLRQTKAAEDALEDAREQAEKTKLENDDLATQLEQIKEQTVKLTNSCAVPDDVRRRLSDIK